MAAKGGMSLKIVDKGMDRLVASVHNVDRTVAGEIGVIDPQDEETAYIAKVHELGLGHNPQRSFMRATLALNREKYTKLASRAYANFLDGKWSIVQAMKAVNTEIVSDMQKRIMRGIKPKLEKATVDAKTRKGMPKPRTALYATGKLFNAIKERVIALGGK